MKTSSRTAARTARRRACRLHRPARARTGLVAAAAAIAAAAHAQSGAMPADPWQYEITPYLWAAGMKGDVRLGTLPTTHVDVGFSEIWENLDVGAMAAFEARKGHLGWLADVVYMKVSTGTTSSRTLPGPGGATLTVESSLNMKQTMFAVGPAYRVSDGPTAVDALGGLRYVNIDAGARIDGSLYGQGGVVARSGDKSWIDPYVGVRVQHPFAERWTAMAYLDVGGFGVGSKFAWQAIVGASYDFSKTVSGRFGYRQMEVDYDQDGFLYDMTNSGAYFGVGLRF
jgi:opacity protein-like surface antigen